MAMRVARPLSLILIPPEPKKIVSNSSYCVISLCLEGSHLRVIHEEVEDNLVLAWVQKDQAIKIWKVTENVQLVSTFSKRMKIGI